jgi:hypothetical protein
MSGTAQMQQTPVRASVIMPAYNAENSIQRAIRSALAQTELQVEVLVIDDASADTTAALVTRIAAQDRRVRLLRNVINRGPAGSRNRGLAEARGDWIVLLDADDEMEPQRIEVLVGLGERQRADVVADNLLLCPLDGNGFTEPMLSPRVLPRGRWVSPAEFVAGNVGSRWTPRISYGFLQPVIRRRFLDEHGLRYEERNRFGEDFLLYVACLLKGARWWLTPEPMYHYMVRPGTLTDVQSAADLRRIFETEEALLRDDPTVAADAALARALRRHKALIRHFHDYRAFADAMKVRDLGRARHLLLASASAFRHIVLESLAQAPRITMKALHGGYHSAPPRPTQPRPGTSFASEP